MLWALCCEKLIRTECIRCLPEWSETRSCAAGAARKEVLELRAHREKASSALASAQQQITDLTRALTDARAMPDKSQVASTLEVLRRHLDHPAAHVFAHVAATYICMHPAEPQQEAMHDVQGEEQSAALYEGRMTESAHVARSEATSGELSLPGTPQRSAVSLQARHLILAMREISEAYTSTSLRIAWHMSMSGKTWPWVCTHHCAGAKILSDIFGEACLPARHGAGAAKTVHSFIESSTDKHDCVSNLLQEAAAVTRSQAARKQVHGHTVSVSLVSDSDEEHQPEAVQEATSSPSLHVHLRVQQDEQPASEQQLRSQLLEQQQLCEALENRSVKARHR